jgi:hypothetical protein
VDALADTLVALRQRQTNVSRRVAPIGGKMSAARAVDEMPPRRPVAEQHVRQAVRTMHIMAYTGVVDGWVMKSR